MSLSKVNDTLKEIKEDTNQLNQNFDDWFDNEKRNRLRDEEARREASRGTSGAAAGGIAGIGGSAAPEQEEGKIGSLFGLGLRNIANLTAGLVGGAGSVLAVNYATRAKKLKQASADAIKTAEADLTDPRNKGVTKSEADLYKARQAQNKIETDIANAEKARAEKYKLNQIAKGVVADSFDTRGGGVPRVTRAEAEYFSKLKAEGKALRAQAFVGPTAPKAPVGGSSPQMTSTAFGAIEAKYNAVKAQMPTVESGKFEKPADIARIKVEDIRVEMTMKDGKPSYFYRNAKNGQRLKTDEAVRILQDSGYKLDGTPDPDFRPVIDTKSSIPKVQRKSRPSIVNTKTPATSISAKGVGLGLGAVGAGSTISAAYRDAGVEGVFGETTQGKITKGILQETLAIPSDFSDFVYGIGAALRGEEYTPQYGPAFREAFSQTNVAQELTSSDSPVVKPNKTLLSVVRAAEAIEMRLGEGILRAATLLGGGSLDDIRQKETAIEQERMNKVIEGAVVAQSLLDEANRVMTNRLPTYMQPPEVNNEPLLNSLMNAAGMSVQPIVLPVPMPQTSTGGPVEVPNNAPTADTIKTKDNDTIYRLFTFGQDRD